MRGRSLGVLLAIGTAFSTATAAHAAGFAINNKSVSALGSGLAGQAALAEDASTIYNNPAGMLQLSGRQASVGLHHLSTTAHFTDEGSDTTGTGSNAASVEADLPAFYYMDEPGPDLRVGVAGYVPFGLGLEYDPQWVGRFHTIDSAIRTYTLSPAVAWRVTPALAVGASVDIQYMDAVLNRAVDFAALCGNPACGEGRTHLSGDSWSWGYSVGLAWRASGRMQVGAVLHSATRQELAGRATFEGVPAPLAAMVTDTDGRVDVDLPAVASLSGAWHIDDRLTLLADYTWTGWSAYRELRIEFDNALPDSVSREEWHDSSRYNLGARYRLSSAWLLRAGFSYDETPVPDAQHRKAMVPDCDRRWYSLGARWEATPQFSLDMVYSYMESAGVPIDNTENTTSHTLTGRYDAVSSFVALQGNWRF